MGEPLRRFAQGDPVRHLSGGWTGSVLYSIRPRADGAPFIRVHWDDGHTSTTERGEDLDFFVRERA